MGPTESEKPADYWTYVQQSNKYRRHGGFIEFYWDYPLMGPTESEKPTDYWTYVQ